METKTYLNMFIAFRIRRENCLHCGNCMEACPFGAVEYKEHEMA